MNNPKRLILQTAVVKLLKSHVDDTRATVEAELEPGDMKRPDGLGSVSLSEPGCKAKVVDDAAFDEVQVPSRCDRRGFVDHQPGVR